MKTDAPEKSKTPTSLRFEQSKAEPVVTVADKDWWYDHRYRVGGALRTLSHSMIITSGLGHGTQPSQLRVGAGALGLVANAFMVVFGERFAKERFAKEDSALQHTIDQARPKNVGRIYYGILAATGALLTASGMQKNRVTEAIAGLWTLGWASYAALAPEEKPDAPIFDKGETKATPQGFVDKQTQQRVVEDYKKHPKKLAADMLQFSALFALVDGVKNKDAARVVSSVCLAASNFVQREMRDTDFKPFQLQPLAKR